MPVKEEPPKREKPKREPVAKRARVEEDAEASVESEASEGFDEEFDEESEGKRNARVVSAGMLKKMAVNKDDMLLVTKNNRGNHHVFINVTRLQQLIRAEGRMIERDPFIAYLGRLPPQQFVSGALLDKAITASLRVQGVAQPAKGVKGAKNVEAAQTGKGVKGVESGKVEETGKAAQQVTEDAKAGGEKKRPAKRQTAPVESEPAGKRQATPAVPTAQVQVEGKEQAAEKAKQGEESDTVKAESSEWRFTGGETRFHSVAELMKNLPAPRTGPPPQLGSPHHAAKLTRKDANTVVGLRSAAHA